MDGGDRNPLAPPPPPPPLLDSLTPGGGHRSQGPLVWRVRLEVRCDRHSVLAALTSAFDRWFADLTSGSLRLVSRRLSEGSGVVAGG